MTTKESSLVPRDRIFSAILAIRGEKVLLDATLAELYGVETRVVVQSVKQNLDRFPHDFMFQLSSEELANLKSQAVISSGWGGRRTEPYAFTEQGVAMLSSVLKSARAVQEVKRGEKSRAHGALIRIRSIQPVCTS